MYYSRYSYDRALNAKLDKPWPLPEGKMQVVVRAVTSEAWTFRVRATFQVDYEVGKGKGRVTVTRKVTFDGMFRTEGEGKRMKVHASDVTARTTTGTAGTTARQYALEQLVPAFRAWHAKHVTQLRCYRASKLFCEMQSSTDSAIEAREQAATHDAEAKVKATALDKALAGDPRAAAYVRKLRATLAREAAKRRKERAARRKHAQPARPKGGA